ncbi:hypothetical protein TWF481_011611 [Arthrobotrys musiformis]|uniref:Uncharacterized protein n=1 Tax=Arthrobotrys musiformis TaxID=47236 RepID=A0AAV9VZ22_9PEZI
MSILMNTLRRATLQSSIRAARGTRMVRTGSQSPKQKHWTESNPAIYAYLFGSITFFGKLFLLAEQDKEARENFRMSMYGYKCDLRIFERDVKILEALVQKRLKEG